MENKEIDEKEANAFLRKCVRYISSASEAQKAILIRTLLERHPESTKTVQNAIAIWNALSEKEIIKLISVLQKQFDKETWEFIARWR